MRFTMAYIALLVTFATGFATNIHVPADYPTIQQGIDAANNGDIVYVASGTYKENINILDKAITVKSEYGPYLTVINGKQWSRVVRIEGSVSGDCVLEGFTIMNGRSFNYTGGGIYCGFGSSPIIRGNRIVENWGGAAGGISCYESDAVIEDNVIMRNLADNYGGGIGLSYSNATISNNVIAKNSAQGDCGGGLHFRWSDAYLTNNTITDNSSVYEGGGMWAESSTLEVSNSIFYMNRSSEGEEITLTANSSLAIQYSDVWENQSRVLIYPGCVLKWGGTTMIGCDPEFYSAADSLYFLRQGPCQPGVVNPCVDGGNPNSLLVEGVTRTDGVMDTGIVDMGYHYQRGFKIHHVPDDFSKIQQAIDAAQEGDTVVVGPGAYYENISYKGKSVIVKSSEGPAGTRISGNFTGSCVAFLHGEGPGAVLSGFELCSGTGTYDPELVSICGGGVVIMSASPTIKDCLIQDNTADLGGGIFWGKTGSPLIMNNTIKDNLAHIEGGGIDLYGLGECLSAPVVKNNIITGNTSDLGGGLRLRSIDDDATVINNYIASNTANFGGGGMSLRGGAKVISNIVCGNKAGKKTTGGHGGGIHLIYFTNPLENNLIYSNTVLGLTFSKGGGIYAEYCNKLEMHNCTVAGNSAYRAGGMYCNDNVAGYPMVRNCIFWDNQAIINPEIETAHTIDIQYSDIEGGWTGAGNINADPLFLNPAEEDFLLMQDPCQPGVVNPCVDAGDPSAQIFDGSTREDNVADSGIMDMGYHARLYQTLHVPYDFATIQEAIDGALSGDTVLVAPGTYVENLNFKGKAITVRGDAGPEQTVIDGGQSGSVVVFRTDETLLSVIEGFTLTNGTGSPGYYYYYGGAINCLDSEPTIRNNIISGNSAFAGGGIHCQGFDCAPLISCNVIRNNMAKFGGGIGCGYGLVELRIECNFIHDNSATSDGSSGGCGGGVIICEDCDVRLMNNTLCHNSADTIGGGLCGTEYCTMEVLNSVFWGNQAPVGPEIALQQYYMPAELSINYCDVQEGKDSVSVYPGSTLNWGSFMIDQDPKFVDPAGGDLHLSWVSPCINRGTCTGAPSHDVDGDPFDYMGGVEMGADEFTGHHPLEATGFTISVSGGADIDFYIDAGPGNGGQAYAVLGSTIGTSPGTPLPNGLVLPLWWDGWTDFVIYYWNSQFFVNFLGKLDATGKAQAKLWVPGLNPVWIGQTMYYACTLYNPFDFVTNPVSIHVEE